MEKWKPKIYCTTKRLLKSVGYFSRMRIRREAINLLSKSTNPSTEPQQKIGLVIGYVQSGKTISFQTVMSLAKDNGFKVVILFAGVSNLLLNQSTERNIRDLGMHHWHHIKNPKNNNDFQQEIKAILNSWENDLPKSEKSKGLLISVLKHQTHIKNVFELANKCNLKDVPSLIIDDEADQAGLNNKISKNGESTIYGEIKKLKDYMKHCTYLQYTATPQAPLLIPRHDTLSPDFVQVLTVGKSYRGGQHFFDKSKSLIQEIPTSEVSTNQSRQVPKTLEKAMQFYLVGAAMRMAKKETEYKLLRRFLSWLDRKFEWPSQDNFEHISMLVHPSHTTVPHRRYAGWVKAVKNDWLNILSKDENNSEKRDFIKTLEKRYNEIKSTSGFRNPSYERTSLLFKYILSNIQVREINSESENSTEINWNISKFWILVGGKSLERGFTVKGLTVTYMPRGPGGRLADAIQQRARFFGYRKPYLGYCRVFLSEDMISKYEGYVEHEENLRQQMIAVQQSERPLDQWMRNLILDPDLNPTRKSVISSISRKNWKGWIVPKKPLCNSTLLENNKASVDAFINAQTFTSDEGHTERTIGQKHNYCEVSLEIVINNLLGKIDYDDSETRKNHNMLLVPLRKVLDDHPNEACIVYQMAPNADEIRTRELKDDFQIKQLFQGANPVSKDHQKGEVYRGDRELRSDDKITIQIHQLELKLNRITQAKNVPVVAVWVPDRFSTSIIYED